MEENRQQPRGGSTEGSRKKMTEDEFFKFIKQGNGYLCGRKRGPVNIRDSDVDLPNGASPEHRYQFKEIWERYFNQLSSTNGMDLDTFPGDAEVAATLPFNLNALKEEDKEYQLIMDLAHLAIGEYNKEATLYKNLTLATVYETFQIHAGAHPTDFAKRVFSCLPKGRALPLPLPLPSLEEVSVDTVPFKST
ncbi:hypothetical protein KY290_007568 [Solanum tuberosum]|uniref:Uncharacterized protein n=1 Tax=Solanum tuberosum TaxID=4113 RepID=A0ABQ7W641_SOLTU|nr:hypothetical protein KY290_007568 [Solanum tuberosum]